MIEKSIIAGNITNLTDARYFAAQGVEFLLFDLSQVPLADIMEIKEWISGPQILLSLDASDIEDQLDEAIIKLAPHAITMNDGDNTPLGYLDGHIQLFKITVENNHQIISLYDMSYTTDTDGAIDDETLGLYLLGGEEQKVGYKSYEDLDDIFDRLLG